MTHNHSEKKPSLLILCEAYPNDQGRAMMYVHTRNVYYKENGIEVTVLNFECDKEYKYEGIRVIPYETYRKENSVYDVLVLHAANLRHHLQFLKKHGGAFGRYIFFFHGHEVLRINKVYPQPYPYVRVNRFKAIIQDAYDTLKLAFWKHYIPQINEKSHYIFVSEWMRDEFLKWTRIPPDVIKDSYSIIYNGVSKEFETGAFDDSCEKAYDFITIRGNLDESKYAIDIVDRIAGNTKDRKFLIVGKGRYFDYNTIPENITWENRTMSHSEIAACLNSAKYALMPTRTDAQGLMMCEMAAFGIPVITSDIAVCHEVFDGFENAYFIDNDKATSLENIKIGESKCRKHTKFFEDNTLKKELEVIISAAGHQ